MDPSVCWSPESAGGCISRVVPVRASCFLKRCRILHISTDCAAYRLIELLNAFGWAAGRWGGRRISICCNICPQLCSISTLITANICTSVGQYVAQRKKKKKKKNVAAGTARGRWCKQSQGDGPWRIYLFDFGVIRRWQRSIEMAALCPFDSSGLFVRWRHSASWHTGRNDISLTRSHSAEPAVLTSTAAAVSIRCT